MKGIRKIIEVIVQEIKVVEVSSLASNKNNFYQFIYIFLCFFTLPKLNTIIKFRLANIFQPNFVNLLLFLKPSV